MRKLAKFSVPQGALITGLEMLVKQKGLVMEVELKKHRWGERAIVTLSEGRDVEVMRFDSAGTDHKHEVVEIATCLTGYGWLWKDGVRERAFGGNTGTVFFIHVGVMHHMEPDPQSDLPFEWLIRYA